MYSKGIKDLMLSLRLGRVAPDRVVKKGHSERDTQGEREPARHSGKNIIAGERKQPIVNSRCVRRTERRPHHWRVVSEERQQDRG